MVPEVGFEPTPLDILSVLPAANWAIRGCKLLLIGVHICMTTSKISDETFIYVVKSSCSIRRALKTLELKPLGGNYATFKRRVARLNLDISHFASKESYLKPWKHAPPIELYKILVINSTYSSSHRLKNRLINEGIVPNKCVRCDIDEWQGEKLSLHLDHINGTSNDNRLENLRLLCPNCHSLTDTYCGKNKTKRVVKPKKLRKSKSIYKCLCGSVIYKGSKQCLKCAHTKQMKIVWPPMPELLERLSNSSYNRLAKELGVSDKAIAKHIKHHSQNSH